MVDARKLTSEELAILGHDPKLIECAVKMIRDADEAQRRVDQKKTPKLLEAHHG